jgi:Ca2+-binding RTX toxin-like protein
VIIRYQISSYKLTGGVKNADISGNAGVTSLTGSSEDNKLVGNNSGDVINGLAGNDILSGGSGNDILNGGSDVDTVDYSAADENIVVDLEANKASGIGIGQDSILGFEVVLSGSGNDQISGGDSSDTLSGGGGSDQIAGGAGNDELIGGAGNDILNGGVGFDCAEYEGTNSNLTINLGDGKVNGTATGGADVGTDSLISIEQACGGSGNDTINGRTDTVSQLDGGLGNDVLTGYGFNDILNGGDGIDTADYSTATTSLIVDLSKGTATGGSDVGADSLTYIENIRGGLAADTLTGDVVTNFLSGGAGNDELIGGAGNDTLDGGVGFDCAEYEGTNSNLTINLGDGKANGTATGGVDVGTDSLISIEEACAGSGNDTIKGRSDTASQLEGGAGNDVLTGYGFNDILIGVMVLIGSLVVLVPIPSGMHY